VVWQRFRFLIAKEFDGYLKLNASSRLLQIGITREEEQSKEEQSEIKLCPSLQ